ncbi:flavin reductase family protein [Candidatus Bipolaricaulota bacterium]|jgi:flavin reductase (DIM6/NTAB) family NADH-FMN oxidoreductase RutF|nr:flavin reductase family protein [Candidatus Bipolaricaulota bacterium]
MSKVKLGAVPLVYPIPIVLVGASVDGKPNFTEVGDCAVMGIKPALVTISLSASHHTTKGIDETGVFSINIPSTNMLSLADYCGIVSGRNVDKGTLFTTFLGDQTAAPLIQECPVGLECRVLEVVQVKHRRLFIAEVVECYVSSQFVESANGKETVPHLSKLDPIIYALDNRYYRIGDAIGTGYQEGMSHKES